MPPTRTLEEREQLHLLRRRVEYEKGNPENVDPVALKVGQTGRQAEERRGR